MKSIAYKLLLLIFIILVLDGCKSSGNYVKHRPTSTKKKHKTHTSHKKETSKKSSTLLKSSPKVQKAIKSARSYTGVKYKYGGTTRSGIDCSALMYNSYKSAGLTLPRNSVAQSRIGKRIYIGELQPGDLVFFATGSSKSKITHVGLITEVKNKSNVMFIHASTSKGVREDNVHDKYYWRARYVKAVRP